MDARELVEGYLHVHGVSDSEQRRALGLFVVDGVVP